MISETICPYFGKDDDQCDIGCGYISPHDVNMIIRFCNGRHLQCLKFLELSDRFPDAASVVRTAGNSPY
jgi:hypothetical protein